MNPESEFSLIKKVPDKYWAFMTEIDANLFLTAFIPDIMLAMPINKDNEWSKWQPIDSTITKKELDTLEVLLKHKLPESYKFFLMQKHFITLQLGESNISFFRSLPEKINFTFEEQITEYYPHLLDRNLLPFAEVSDWGVLCFDAQTLSKDNDYPIVELDHEDFFEEKRFYAKNFLSMFKEFDLDLSERIKNYRKTH